MYGMLMKVGGRIYLGFGALLVAMASLAIFTVTQMSVVNSNMREANRLTENMSKAQDAGLEAVKFRRAILRYIWDNSDDARSQAEQNAADALKVSRDLLAGSPTSSPRHNMYRSAVADFEALGPMIKQVFADGTALQKNRATLFTVGDTMTADMQAVFDALWRKGGVFEGEVAKLQSAVLLVRVANWRFLAIPDVAGIDAFNKRVEEASKEILITHHSPPI